MSAEARAFARFARALPAFLRHTFTHEECLRRIRDGLADREENFLQTLELGVYARPDSPYRALLERAGAELGDVRRMVADLGVEGALACLYDAGVYVSLEEFKGRRPIERPGLSLEVEPDAFDQPLPRAAYVARTSGSRSPQRRMMIDLDHLENEALHQSLFLAAFELDGRPIALWKPVPPGRSALKQALSLAKIGRPVERWFSQQRLLPSPSLVREFAGTTYAIGISKLTGTPLPLPRYVPVGDALTVARWLAAKRQAGARPVLVTIASSGVRICVAAEEHGLEIGGTLFRFGGEPLTAARVEVVANAGAKAICHYSMGEVGRVGVACAAPLAVDDVHILTDKVAVIQRDRALPDGRSVGALLLSTLLPSSPRLLLNVETDDYGTLGERECGCAVGAAGFSLHLHQIRSYDKLTSEGMNFLGADVLSLLEEVLPRRFGGSPTDYQLVEEEVGGLTKVSVVVSPRVGPVVDADVVATVLGALGSGPAYKGMMSEIWRGGDTLRVIRREPYATPSSKVLSLHVLR